MANPDLVSIIAAIEARYPGWVWLIRNDEEKGCFAHIMKPDLFTPEDYVEGVSSFPAYAATATDALSLSFDQLSAAHPTIQ